MVLPLSRAVARRRRLANSGSQTHTPRPPTPRRLQLSNSMLSDNRGTYVSRISTHFDIAPATNHNKATLDFNNYATKLSNHTLCKATHDGFCVEISQTTSRLTGNRNGFTHARQALCGRVSTKLDERLGDKFANRIRFRHFRHNRNTKSDSDRWSYRPVNCICTKKYTVYRGSCRFSAGVEASVT